MKQQANEFIVSLAWQMALRLATRQQPSLAALAAQKREQTFARFSHHYCQLLSAPRKVRRRLGASLASVALALALSGAPTPAHAATITVTPGAAGVNNGDGCSLVEAIINANSGGATYPECSAGSPGADTIVLSGNTYSYTTAFGIPHGGSESALPFITSAITIEGNGATIRRTSGTMRILDVGSGTGNLTLNSSTITGGNSNARGGGILNSATLTINDSTVNNNTSTSFGGGIYNFAGGALTVNNSTISGNTGLSGGGIESFGGTVVLNNSTITGNSTTGASGGGGLYLGGSTAATLNRSIVSGNTASMGAEIRVVGASLNLNNLNVLGHSGLNNAQAFVDFTSGGSDRVATSNGNLPTALTSILNTTLADNGGPTPTHALVGGSPAIDLIFTVHPNCNPGTTFDQRGALRASGVGAGGSACDAGAFEFGSVVVSFYPVTAALGVGNGTITPPSQDVAEGSNATFEVIPSAGWSVDSVTGNTCSPAFNMGNQWVAANITQACSVTANFVQDTFIVTTSVATGQGSITPPSQNVVFDGTANFTVTPNTGWFVDSVTGNTCTPALIAGTSWEASNIQDDCSVQASFVINNYLVSAEVGTGDGSITPLSQSVDHGDDASFTVTPDLGWSVTTVVGDSCTPINTAGTTWEAANITQACSVTANFAEDTFNVTTSVAAGQGTITPPSQNVVFDGTATFTVTPETGWSVDTVVGDTCSPALVAGTSWEATNIQADCAVQASFVINSYVVSAAVGTGDGSITPLSQNVDHGSEATFTVTPDLGWSVTAVVGDTCSPINTAGPTWEAANITQACSVTANFAEDTFNVTTSVAAGQGTITPPSQNVSFDGTANFTVTPETGWSVDTVVGDTCSPALVAGTSWEASNIQDDCSVQASFVINNYLVSAEVGTGDGSITPLSQSVDHGDDASFTVTPDLGWSVTTVVGDTCTPINTAGTTWEAANITQACSVTANFAEDTLNVTTSVAAGQGTITPPSQNVSFDGTANFTVAPETGWSVNSVTGDTCSPAQVAGTSWEATNIQADCAVQASFVINSYVVSAAVGTGDGTITPLSQSVDHGDDASFTVTPDLGWSVTTVVGDTCTPINTAGTTWEAANITQACSVTANFAEDTFNVTTSVAAGQGTITPPSQNVVFDGTATFTVTPETGWSVNSVTGDTCSPAQVAGTSWEATNIQADCAVQASFVINSYVVSAAVGTGDGSITPAIQNVDHGSDATFTVTPDLGWDVTTVVGDTCTPINTAGTTWEATNITEACSVTANFAQDTFSVTTSVAAGQGTITPPSQNVVFDGTATFTVTPETGWSVDTVTGTTCTPALVAGTSWAATTIQDDCAVEASFLIANHVVTASVGSGNGSITPLSQNVDHGNDATFTVTADSGWTVATVSGDTCVPTLFSGDQWIATNITEACTVTVDFQTNTYTVGGTVTGLVGSGLLLQNNGADDLPINSNGSFTFATALDDLSSYQVSVLSQPNGQFCSVDNASGTLSGNNAVDVLVACSSTELGLSLTNIQFVSVPTGEDAEQLLTLTNIGQTDLIIDMFVAPNEPFGFAAETCAPLPRTLAPGESCSVLLRFEPTAPGNFADELWIATNSLTSPHLVTLSGSTQQQAQPIPTLGLPAILLMVLSMLLIGLRRRQVELRLGQRFR